MELSSETTAGQEFCGKPRKITWERLWAFSGGAFSLHDWPKKNIHTDNDFANSVGLPEVIVSATQYQGYLVSLLLDLMGEEWLRHGTMQVKFVKIVAENDTIQPKVRVVSKEKTVINEQPVTRVILEVWCDNQQSEKVLVGEATGLI